ncbi:hypothetical protein ebA3877 [Aromatoleum aromaticum EbN1]|uniref:Uncharacterized protein n=1 Tax=Aromatoleum aromaticum (strain DSM 19018 / LMG 30748 / EbN1) TaxID=76114 RepID=Q5P2Z0_AROAE|nr:hypothetical protein ebA3877 [Aromatoleum aromaticum EbN1]
MHGRHASGWAGRIVGQDQPSSLRRTKSSLPAAAQTLKRPTAPSSARDSSRRLRKQCNSCNNRNSVVRFRGFSGNSSINKVDPVNTQTHWRTQ